MNMHLKSTNLNSIFRNIFIVLCSAITLLLLCQLLLSFAIEKPTTTTTIEKKLETTDLPDVVICMDPGYDKVTLNKYGYHSSTYFRGAMQPGQPGASSPFVGWNGGIHENKSSLEILEEALLLPKNGQLITQAWYTENYIDSDNAVVTFRVLGDYIGRCISISPPLVTIKPHHLWIQFNSSFFDQFNLSRYQLYIYFMDRANSPHFYPDLMEMVMGYSIWVGHEPSIYTYRTRLSKSEHIEGDPLFECAVYTKNNSYDMCIREELEEVLAKELGCQPPYLSNNPNNLCDKKFNASNDRSLEIASLFWEARNQLRCKTPCTKNKYTTYHQWVTPYSFRALDITFDKKVDISRSRFIIDGPTFLTKSGGFIGVGRTLLWILVSLLGTAQVHTREK